jgi:hypothetical protein
MIKPIPLDIHEGQIAHHRERERAAGRKEIEDDRALEALVSAGAKMRKNAETAREMAEAISADKTVAGVTYRQRYADDTAKLEAIAAKRMDAVLGEIGRLSKTITPATPSDKHLASEIRATLARLPEKEREEQLARQRYRDRGACGCTRFCHPYERRCAGTSHQELASEQVSR